MARMALCLHALREVGRDEKDLQPLMLGGGVQPANNKDPKAMLTETDRKASDVTNKILLGFIIVLFL